MAGRPLKRHCPSSSSPASEVEGILEDLFEKVVRPTEMLSTLTENSVSASQLKMGEHFYEQSITDFEDGPSDIQQKLKKFLKPSMDRLPEENRFTRSKNIANCHLRIIENLEALHNPNDRRHGIKNEAEFRFALLDPIAIMLCRLGNLKMSLEETVKKNMMLSESVEDTAAGPSNLATPNISRTKAISKISHPDYTLYTLSDNQVPGCVAAIIIEAKLESNRNGDSIAQLIGYVIAFKKEQGSLQPPLALLITEEFIQFALFPFKVGNEPLVTAVVTKPRPLYNYHSCLLDLATITLLIDLTVQRPTCSISLPFKNFDKELLRRFDSVIKKEKTKAQLNAELAENAAKVAELETEKEQLTQKIMELQSQLAK